MNWKGNAKQKVEALIVPEIETLNEDNKTISTELTF